MSNEPAGSLDQDESLTAELIAQRQTQLDLHHSSHLNKSLLFGTLVGLAVVMAAIWYVNQHRLNDVAANLLILADQAEEDEDWQLLRTRLQRYLAIRSDDAQVMQRLADIYHDRAETLEEIRAGMKLYSRCLASYPRMSDNHLRNYLKYLSMQARLDPVASIQGLDELIPKNQEPQNPETESTQPVSQNTIKAIRLRIMIREQLLPMLVDENQIEGRQHLIDDYEQLIASEPGEPRLRQNLAFQYQLHAHSVARFDAELAQQMRTKADQLMNSVTNSNMNDIDVLMRRFEYGRRFANTGHANTSDLQRILELDRNNPQALLYLAMLLSEPSAETGETSAAALKAAKEFLHESIENLPQEPYALISLANIQTRLNDQSAAFETLQKASALYPESDIVCVARASMAISQKRFDDAKKEIDTLRRIANEARTYDRSRSQEINLAKVQQAHADVLEAELLIESKPATHDHAPTLLLLKNVDLPSLQSHGRADVLQQAGHLIARLNSWESAIEPLERARNTGAISIPSSFLLARCYQQGDDQKRAIEIYRELTSRQLPASQARLAWFGLGMINLQTRLDDVERGDRLQEAQQAWDRMKIVAPASLETFLLKTYLQLATGTADRSTIISQLQSVESRFSSEAQYWMLCANVYRTFDDFVRLRVAEQRLAESVGGMPNNMVPGDKTVPKETMESLNLTANLSQEDLDHLEEVAGSWDQSDPDQRLMMIRRWCDEVPNSISARFSLANLGIATKQLAIVDEAVELLREIDTGSDAFLRIAEIHRDLIAFRGGDALAGEQATRKAVALLQEHPDHPVFLQLAAFCEETSADLAAASEHYRQAVEHGASQAAIDGRIRTLVHQRKWDQALEFIEQSSPETWAQPDRLELAVHVLCHHRKFDEAVRMIRATADQSPLSAQGHYLMAMTLMAESRNEHVVQAHQHLQAAVQREPGNLGYRISLFHLQINYSPELWSYQSYIAANQIRWLLQSYEKEFAPSWPALILAETLRFGGRIGEAEELFRKVVAIESDLDDRSWIPQPILSRHAMATAAPVTPAIAWLAGAENARTLFAIQALWHRDDTNDLEISEDDVRLQTLLALRSHEPLTAIHHLESIPEDERGVGDHLFLAALHDRTGNEQAADGHRADCLEKSQQSPEVVEQLLADALAKENFDFAKRCLDERKSQGDTSVQLHVSQARIDLATEIFPADLDRWLSERQDELSSDSDRKQFFDEILNVLADQGKAKLAMKTLEHSVTNLADGELTSMLWAASQKALASRVMRFLNDEDRLVSASDQTEMLYRLIQHLPQSSPHLERLGELAITILDSSPTLESIEWIKLGYVLEHLELPELAISACEKALPDDGSPSLFEHYIIWLRSGYLRNLSNAQTELDRLVRVFGPRDDLMDTRVVLFLRDQNAAAAAEISRDLALHDTLNRAHQANDRLASALLQPEDEREEALIEVEQRYGSELSLLAKQILRDHLTLD